MERSDPKRQVWLGAAVAILGFGAFSRTVGADSVRVVQMISLVAAGMGLGIVLVCFRTMLARRGQ